MSEKQKIQRVLEKIQDPEHAETVAKLVQDYNLDFIDTRRVIMLLESDPDMPKPAAVAMVQHIRSQPVGQALTNVEKALDVIERLPKLTGTERVMIRVLLDHLSAWIGRLQQHLREQTP